jgi:ABC-type proline/glycine betaine transport system permease subunit
MYFTFNFHLAQFNTFVDGITTPRTLLSTMPPLSLLLLSIPALSVD